MAAPCRLVAFARSATAVHGSGSSTGHASSSALAAVRAARSWNAAGAASLIAACNTGLIRIVARPSARLIVIRPARSQMSSASQAGWGSTGVPNPTAGPPR